MSFDNFQWRKEQEELKERESLLYKLKQRLKCLFVKDVIKK